MPGIVLCEARAPYVGAPVKKWKPGHGDNGIRGEIIGIQGEMIPTQAAWSVMVRWPDGKQSQEMVTY